MNTYEEFLANELRSKVYNALAEIASEYPDVDEQTFMYAMDEAIEWFQVHFYNDCLEEE